MGGLEKRVCKYVYRSFLQGSNVPFFKISFIYKKFIIFRFVFKVILNPSNFSELDIFFL